MEPSDLRARRKRLGMTQTQMARALGLSRDFIGQMERGVAPIAPRTALAIAQLQPAAQRCDACGQIVEGGLFAHHISPRHAKGATPAVKTLCRACNASRTHDPMERIIAEALVEAGIAFETEATGDTHRLDFYLPQLDLFIEVKRMHSPRIAEQTARVENVIVAQGLQAVQALAAAIRGGFGRLASAAAPANND